MRKVDETAYSSKAPRIKPEKVSLGNLPPITKKPEKTADSKPGTYTKVAMMEKRSSVQVNGRTDEQVNERASERTNARTNERVNGRTISIDKPEAFVRCSYQLSPHQRDIIKKIAFERSMAGEKIDQSQVLREAIEYYLEMRTGERTNE